MSSIFLNDGFASLTHHLLKQKSPDYAHYVEQLGKERWSDFCAFWDGVQVALNDCDDLPNQHEKASRALARKLVVVQEKEFEYRRIADDWIDTIFDRKQLVALYQDAGARLEGFLSRNCSAPVYSFYGGIKPETSIRSKFHGTSSPIKDERARPLAHDVWDAVRFRIVFETIEDLSRGAIDFWRLFLEDIIRCRNYYYRPRNSSNDDSYRAIHFELVDARGRIIEIQMMTNFREFVSVMDHAFLFKQSVPFISEQHRDWLVQCGLIVNVADSKNHL